jgi:hypothetical protein
MICLSNVISKHTRLANLFDPGEEIPGEGPNDLCDEF